MTKGWFITFEGGEGTGKSTQLVRLQQRLREHGMEIVSTREPGGTPLAEALRALLLDPAQEPDGLSELLLIAAARHDHVQRVIRPALSNGQVVLCDRFSDSTLVYQGIVRDLGLELVERINRHATGGLDPDLTMLLDMSAEAALKRARQRNITSDSCESRLDDEPLAFHRSVREGFLQLASRFPERIRVIDAEQHEQEVFQDLVRCLPRELQ